MTDLDALERDARDLLDGLHPQFADGLDARLAEALIAVLPVVRAAEEWTQSNVPVRTARVTKADLDLCEAVDALRATLRGGG